MTTAAAAKRNTLVISQIAELIHAINLVEVARIMRDHAERITEIYGGRMTVEQRAAVLRAEDDLEAAAYNLGITRHEVCTALGISSDDLQRAVFELDRDEPKAGAKKAKLDASIVAHKARREAKS
jgi:hypothetical protein